VVVEEDSPGRGLPLLTSTQYEWPNFIPEQSSLTVGF
jgi:hypothetical protein